MEESIKFSRSKEIFAKAYETLVEAINKPRDSFMRDSTIKRFEYTIESGWKSLRQYMVYQDNLEHNTPGSVVREAYSLGYIIDLETWKEALNYRNRSVHNYDENFANETYEFIIKNHKIFRELLDFLKLKS